MFFFGQVLWADYTPIFLAMSSIMIAIKWFMQVSYGFFGYEHDPSSLYFCFHMDLLAYGHSIMVFASFCLCPHLTSRSICFITWKNWLQCFTEDIQHESNQAYMTVEMNKGKTHTKRFRKCKLNHNQCEAYVQRLLECSGCKTASLLTLLWCRGWNCLLTMVMNCLMPQFTARLLDAFLQGLIQCAFL